MLKEKSVINRRVRTSFVSIVSLMSLIAFLFLELLLLPWEDVEQLFSNIPWPSSISLLNGLCIFSGLLTLILNWFTITRMEKELKKERERLTSTMVYIKLLNQLEENQMTYEKVLEKMLLSERISKKEYKDLQTLYTLTSKAESSATLPDIDNVIDNAKTGLQKIAI